MLGLRKTSSIYYLSLTAFVIWSLLIGIASYFDISTEKQKTIELARKEALTIFNKDVALRHWAARHGGVYVPVSEQTPPSPYLSHIAERDITTPSGKKLTLMNPAYILRQVMSGYADKYQIRAHLTSLNVLNPINAPDEWERRSLGKMEAGASEVFAVDYNAEGPALRLIRPLITQLGCLKCHAKQGYKVGDIRGGVSISLPLEPYLLSEQQAVRGIMLIHLLFWLTGSLTLLIMTFWARNRLIENNAVAETLRKSELDFRSIFNNSPVPMVIVDKENDILSYNGKFTKLFGYTLDDISTAENWWNTVYPDPAYREKIKASWTKAIAKSEASGEEIETQVWEMVCKDDTRRTVEFDLMPLAEVSVIAMNDITESKRIEKKLRKSEERYKDAQQLAHIGHWELDIVNNELLWWSDEIYRIFEIDPEKFGATYEAFIECIHPEDRDKVNKAYSDSLISKTPYNITHRLLFNDNGERIKYVQERCHSEYNDSGEPVRSIGTVQDITEQKHAEATRILLETAIDQTADSIFITDPQGNIQYANPSFERITGYTSEEVLGKNPRILKSGRQDPAFYREMWATLSSGKIWTGHLVNKKKDGSLFDEEATISPVLDRNGKIINYVAVKRDVTEVMNIEKKLQQAQKMEAIGTLAGGITHDFNNILGAILGYADLAREDSPKGSSVAKDLDKVLQAGNRARDLVKQILTFSRQADTEYIPLQPASIVKEVIKMLRASLPTTIEISQNIAPQTGLILADPTQIHQILMNLCTNAFHAMESTGGKLDISLKETDLRSEDLTHEPSVKAGTFVQLSICDSGPGIAPEIKDKIFDPYFTTKETGKGTGMGLSIVHGIVKSYGGFISLQSEIGEGTAFHVFLPVMEKEALPEIEAVEQIPTGKERILFVDDEKILSELGKDMLERLGYQVTIRNDSLEALQTFQNQPDQFDLVITDQTMPGMTGTDLARRMMQTRPGIPIILCTGYSTIISGEKAKSMGIKEFVLKPLVKKDIAKLIRKVLDVS